MKPIKFVTSLVLKKEKKESHFYSLRFPTKSADYKMEKISEDYLTIQSLRLPGFILAILEPKTPEKLVPMLFTLNSRPVSASKIRLIQADKNLIQRNGCLTISFCQDIADHFWYTHSDRHFVVNL